MKLKLDTCYSHSHIGLTQSANNRLCGILRRFSSIAATNWPTHETRDFIKFNDWGEAMCAKNKQLKKSQINYTKIFFFPSRLFSSEFLDPRFLHALLAPLGPSLITMWQCVNVTIMKMCSIEWNDCVKAMRRQNIESDSSSGSFVCWCSEINFQQMLSTPQETHLGHMRELQMWEKERLCERNGMKRMKTWQKQKQTCEKFN